MLESELCDPAPPNRSWPQKPRVWDGSSLSSRHSSVQDQLPRLLRGWISRRASRGPSWQVPSLEEDRPSAAGLQVLVPPAPWCRDEALPAPACTVPCTSGLEGWLQTQIKMVLKIPETARSPPILAPPAARTALQPFAHHSPVRTATPRYSTSA